MRIDYYPVRNFSWIAAAVGAGTLIYGAVKSGQAKKEAHRLQENRPVYKGSPYTGEELSLLEREVANPMSAEARAAYNQSTDRDLSTSLDAILKGGGNPNNVGDIFDRSQEGRQRLAIFTDQLRLQKINNLVSSFRNAQEQGDRSFQFNQYAPWADETQANSQARQSAAALEMQGVKTLGGAVQSYAGSGDFSGGGSNATSSSPTTANWNFNQNNGNTLFSQPNDITNQTTNSPFINGIGGGSQGWYIGG